LNARCTKVHCPLLVVLAAVVSPVTALAGAGPKTEASLGKSFSVLEHHNGPFRQGVYIDPAFTREAAAGIQLELTVPIEGVVNAQPLFVDGGGKGPDTVFVATENNVVFAIDATSGAEIWRRYLDPPVPGQTITDYFGGFRCGRWDPFGITGTPVIDEVKRRIYLALVTPDKKRVTRNLVYALSLDDGETVPGWPVDIAPLLGDFIDPLQAQRGALILLHDRLYVPYGSHSDCGWYHGRVIGVPVDNPDDIEEWATKGQGNGIWGNSGIASDGTSLFVATANGSSQSEWDGAEAIIRLSDGPVFSGSTADYFAPEDWHTLDDEDLDLGASGVVLFDLPGTDIPLALAIGKNSKIYLADRSNLGGIGGELVAQAVSNIGTITTPSVYTTSEGTFVTLFSDGLGLDCLQPLVGVRIDPTSPPTLTRAWCSEAPGPGGTMVTTTDGQSESIVWIAGAEYGIQLLGVNGVTGETIALADGLGPVIRYTAPMAAKGRIYVAGTDWLYVFAIK
jgi:hypothetical protein